MPTDPTPHLPPLRDWRQAQTRARLRGQWLDLTLDGMYHLCDTTGATVADYPTCDAALAALCQPMEL